MRRTLVAVVLLGAVGCSEDRHTAPTTKGRGAAPSPFPSADARRRGGPAGTASADPLGAVSLPDARSCHRRCLDAGDDATAESCRSMCEEACKKRCEGRGSAFASQCAADCRDELDAVMAASD